MTKESWDVIGLAVLALLFAGGAWGVVALVRGTRNQGKMGINLNPPTACPQCGLALPQVRMPKNLRQALWGGWTCAGCNLEVDKWGRVVGG
jgi:hypothetical protein